MQLDVYITSEIALRNSVEHNISKGFPPMNDPSGTSIGSSAASHNGLHFILKCSENCNQFIKLIGNALDV